MTPTSTPTPPEEEPPTDCGNDPGGCDPCGGDPLCGLPGECVGSPEDCNGVPGPGGLVPNNPDGSPALQMTFLPLPDGGFISTSEIRLPNAGGEPPAEVSQTARVIISLLAGGLTMAVVLLVSKARGA